MCATALAAAVALSAHGVAGAAPAGSPAPAVGGVTAGSDDDIRIEPGQSLALESGQPAGVTYQIEEGPESTLPAGWSVLTSPTGLRITASATAADGEFATVKATGPEGDAHTLRVVVAGAADTAAPTPTGHRNSSSSSWVSELVGKLALFFAS